MKTPLSLVLLFILPIIASAGVSPEVLDRCNFGYRSMKRMKPAAFRDNFAPDPKVTPRDLCATLFNDNQADPSYPWLRTTISHLRIHPREVKPRDFMSPDGQCRIGALIYLKKHFIDFPIPAKFQMTYDACKRIKKLKKP